MHDRTTHTTARHASHLLAGVLVAVLLLAACSDDDDAGADGTTTTIDQDDTTSSTTSSSTSTTASTTTEPASDEDQILALLEEFETFFERTGDPPEPDSPLIDELFTDPLRARISEAYAGRAAEGSSYGGNHTIEVLDVAVTGDLAIVAACGVDGTTRYAPDGSVAEPPDASPTEYAFMASRGTGGWRISEFNSFEDRPCDLP